MGTVSVPPSKAICCGGEVALGGCSLSELAPWFEEDMEVTAWGAAWVVLLLLKTCPSADSSSSSEGTTTTLLPLSRGLVQQWLRPRLVRWLLWGVVWRRKRWGRCCCRWVLGRKVWRGSNGFRGWEDGIPNPLGRSLALRLQGLGELPSPLLIHF